MKPKAESSMTERALVKHINGFLVDQYKDKNADSVAEALKAYVSKLNLQNKNEETLKAAILIQLNIINLIKERRSIGSSNHDKEQIEKEEDKDDVVLRIILLTLTNVLAASYGMGNDLVEVFVEMSNDQRVGANIATLALTGAYTYGAVTLAMAVFATNPIGAGIFVAVNLVFGLALLVKATRLIINSLDAEMTEESGLEKDSRFKLTTKDLLNLQRKKFTKEDIDKIKDVIRTLAIEATAIQETAFFGSNTKYLQIIDKLTKVKNGTISPEIAERYNINVPELNDPVEPRYTGL